LPITEVGQTSSTGRCSPRSRFPRDQCQRLDGLAEAHVIGQDAPNPQRRRNASQAKAGL